jgi:hypothetical protein
MDSLDLVACPCFWVRLVGVVDDSGVDFVGPNWKGGAGAEQGFGSDL